MSDEQNPQTPIVPKVELPVNPAANEETSTAPESVKLPEAPVAPATPAAPTFELPKASFDLPKANVSIPAPSAASTPRPVASTARTAPIKTFNTVDTSASEKVNPIALVVDGLAAAVAIAFAVMIIIDK